MEETPRAPMHAPRRHPSAYDLRAASRDINVIFPLEYLRTLEAPGESGELAPNAYSFHVLTNVPRLREVFALTWAQQVLQEGVEAAALTPS